MEDEMQRIVDFVSAVTPEEWRPLRDAIARPYAGLPEPERSDRINMAIGAMVRDGSLLRLLNQRRAQQAQEGE